MVTHCKYKKKLLELSFVKEWNLLDPQIEGHYELAGTFMPTMLYCIIKGDV